MQLDATELEAEIDSVGGNDPDMDTNGTDKHGRLDVASAGKCDGSDEEYEAWNGFNSDTYLRHCQSQSCQAKLPCKSVRVDKTRENKDTKGRPRGTLKFSDNAKPRGHGASVGMIGKRRATPIPETYVAHQFTCHVSQSSHRLISPA